MRCVFCYCYHVRSLVNGQIYTYNSVLAHTHDNMSRIIRANATTTKYSSLTRSSGTSNRKKAFFFIRLLFSRSNNISLLFFISQSLVIGYLRVCYFFHSVFWPVIRFFFSLTLVIAPTIRQQIFLYAIHLRLFHSYDIVFRLLFFLHLSSCSRFSWYFPNVIQQSKTHLWF